MRFRRKSGNDQDVEAGGVDEASAGAAEPVGPLDADALGADVANGETPEGYLDFGSLLLREPPSGYETQIQVDEQSGVVMAIMLIGEQGGMGLRAFAAARGGDLWGTARQEIGAETARMGGTADEAEGDFGTELVCVVPATMPDGTPAQQVTRIIGVSGPRWFLRATLMGMPAAEPEQAADLEGYLRSVVVRRGRDAMPPGEMIPITLPGFIEGEDPGQPA